MPRITSHSRMGRRRVSIRRTSSLLSVAFAQLRMTLNRMRRASSPSRTVATSSATGTATTEGSVIIWCIGETSIVCEGLGLNKQNQLVLHVLVGRDVNPVDAVVCPLGIVFNPFSRHRQPGRV